MSLRSMTGFGHASGPVGDAEMELWARSLNHRSLDLTIRVRDAEAQLEPVLRRVFSRRITRGKVDIMVRVKRLSAAGYEVTLNEELLQAVLARFALLAGKFPLAGRLEARDLLAIPQIFSVDNRVAEFSPQEIAQVEALADRVTAGLIETREREGRGITQDILTRIGRMRSKAVELSARRGEITSALRANLRERISVLLADLPLDAARLEQEAALAADRSDISEELQRLEAHLEQVGRLVDSASEPVGKKLEFLSQEILRELNTLGSKARDLQLVRDVVDMKSETEKIREQIGNVE